MNYHDILNIILTNKNRILRITIIATVFLFLILLLVYPKTYKSTITILPPDENNHLSGVESLLGGQDFSDLLMSGSPSANSQLYMEILKSRSAAMYVIEKNNLQQFYNIVNNVKAAEKLDNNLNVEVSKEGIISLNVDVSTSLFPLFTGQVEEVKILSADLSNSFANALDSLNKEKLISKAKQTREFIEQQLLQTKASLDSVENELMKFQENNKTISLPQQVNAAIDAAASLRTEIVKTEIEIGAMENNLRANNKALLALKNELVQLKDQYAKMEIDNQDYLLNFKNMPELGKKLTDLLREVKIQNEVYAMLQQQYYKEKIQENKDIPTVQVLDSAIPPLQASSPRLIFGTITGGILIFVIICLITLVNERKIYFYKNNMKEK